MAYNNILDFTNTEIAYVNGPITVQQAKDYCRVQNTTTGQDELFALWIRAARTKIENYTGLSLIPRNIVCILTNPQGNIELPFGPVTGTPTFIGTQGETQSITTQGLNFPYVPLPFEYSKVSYTAGYADGAVPDELQQAMLAQISYWWENRGDQVGIDVLGWCPLTITICQKYKRLLP